MNSADRFLRGTAGEEHLVSAAEPRLQVHADGRDDNPHVCVEHAAIDEHACPADFADRFVPRRILPCIRSELQVRPLRTDLLGRLAGGHLRVHSTGEDELDLLIRDSRVTDFTHDDRKNLIKRGVTRYVLENDHNLPVAIRRKQFRKARTGRGFAQRPCEPFVPILIGARLGGFGDLLDRPIVRKL